MGTYTASFDTIARQRTMVMLRTISGEVSAEFSRFLEELYDSKNNPLGSKCAKWHWKIVRFCNDKTKAMGLVAMIMYSFELDYDISKDKNWLRMMRMIMPSEFVAMFKESFTQVPRMALLDDNFEGKGSGSEKFSFTQIKMV